MQLSGSMSLVPLLIIDGFNVLHAGVLVGRARAEWWKEGAQRRLVERIEQFSDFPYQEIWIVFDRRKDTGKQRLEVASTDPRIQVHYAPSADEWIVKQVSQFSLQRRVTVVTADRLLRERVRQAGGTLYSPLQFLAHCG
jgi:predicted RNA-binding protein with PIN domain